MRKKINIIIDTDPGVDDAIADIMALFEKRLNILLFTTVAGNVDTDTCTRNILHILEYYNKNIPVAVGAKKPLTREHRDAKFIHGEEGTGKYTPSQPSLTPVSDDAVEAMYKAILAHKNNVTVLLLGPQTNMAELLTRHPEVEDMISRIIYMGASGYGQKGIKPHISFNISSDPEAFKKVLKSKIPLTMIPSEIGRGSHLKEWQVEKIKQNKIVGKMMFEMLDGYWEPGYEEKVVAMNDSCAIYYLLHPTIFKTKKAFIDVNTTTKPGKTYFHYHKRGRVDAVYKVNVKKFHSFFFKHLNKIK